MKILSEAYKVYREHPVFKALYGSLLEMNQSGEIPFNLVAAAIHKYDEVVVTSIEATSNFYAITAKNKKHHGNGLAVYRGLDNHWWLALRNVTVYSIPYPTYNISVKRKVKQHKIVANCAKVKIWAYSALGEKSPYEMVNIPGPMSNPYTIDVDVKRKTKKPKFVEAPKEVCGYNPLMNVMALGKGEGVKKEGEDTIKDFTQPMPYNEKLKLAKSDEHFHTIAMAQEGIMDVLKGRYRKHPKPWPLIKVKRCGPLSKPVDFEPLLRVESRRERREREVKKARRWVGREYICKMDRQGNRLADLADKAGGTLHLPGHNVEVEADKEMGEALYETRRKEKLGGLVVMVRQKRSKWQVHPVHNTSSSSDSSESSDEDLDSFYGNETGMLRRWSSCSIDKDRRRSNRSNSCDPGLMIKQEKYEDYDVCDDLLGNPQEKTLSFLDDLKTDDSQMETSHEISRSTYSHATDWTSQDISQATDKINISIGRLDISGAGHQIAAHQPWQNNPYSHKMKNEVDEMLNLSPIHRPKFSPENDFSFVDEAMTYNEIKAGSVKRIFKNDPVDSLRPMAIGNPLYSCPKDDPVDSLCPMPIGDLLYSCPKDDPEDSLRPMTIGNLLYSCPRDDQRNPSTPKRATHSTINTPMPSPSYSNLQESNLQINTPVQNPLHSLTLKDSQGSSRKTAKSDKFVIEDDLLDFEWEGDNESSSESEGCSPMRSPIKSPEILNVSPSVSLEPSSVSFATESSQPPAPLFQLNFKANLKNVHPSNPFQSKPKIHPSNPFQNKPKIHPSNPFQSKPKVHPSNPFQSKPKIHPSNPFQKQQSTAVSDFNSLNQQAKTSNFLSTFQPTVGLQDDNGSFFSPLSNLHAPVDNLNVSLSSTQNPELPNFIPGYTPSNDFSDLSGLLDSSQTPELDQSFKLDFLSQTNPDDEVKE